MWVMDLYLFYQNEDVKNVENVVNKEFSSHCQWLINVKLLIQFGEDETKLILVSEAKDLKGNEYIRCESLH